MPVRVIYKYVLADPGTGEVHMLDLPKDAHMLSVQLQGDQPVVWALVDRKAPPERCHYVWVPTGGAAPGGFDYVATLQFGSLVYHLFGRDA